MPIPRPLYEHCVGKLERSKERLKVDRQIIKMINNITRTKNLSPRDTNRFNDLIGKQLEFAEQELM